MSRFQSLSDSEIHQMIHGLEALGHRGRDYPLLHELNCEQTDRMTDSELMSTVRQRESVGEGADKARAALRGRGYSY